MRTILLCLGFALSALCALSQGGCASSKASDTTVVVNGQCRCEGDALCLQQAGVNQAPIACIAKAASCNGCACFTTPSRSCWPSPSVSGLCMCSGSALPQGASLAQSP